MTYTKNTKALAILLAIALLVVMLPAFVLAAAEAPAYEESPASLTAAGGNLALGATVIAQYEATGLALLNDGTMNSTATGNDGYRVDTDAAEQATLLEAPHSEWVGLDLGAAKEFNSVTVYPSRDADGICRGMPNTMTVEVSANGSDWTAVYYAGNLVFDTLKGYTFEFAPVAARYVRVIGYISQTDADGKYAMKLSEIALHKSAAAKVCPNLAIGRCIETSGYHPAAPTWDQGYIDDGNRYNLSTTTFDYGQYTGWHTQASPSLVNEDAYFVFDLKNITKLDKVVVVPATERFHYKHPGTDALYLPSAISVQVSSDNSTWTDVATCDTMPTTYEDIVITFTAVEARYVRVNMTASGNYVKLSEIEIYDTSKTVTAGETDDTVITKPNTNMALEGTVIASSILSSPENGWTADRLNDNALDLSGGFTTADSSATGTAWVGYEFDNLTTVNKVVLYPAGGSGYDTWSGLPKTFTVDYTVDNINWITVATVTNAVPAFELEPVTVTFDAVNVRKIRINSSELYPKNSDGGRMYIQLAEMEVWNSDEDTELASGFTGLSAFVQTRPADTAGMNDMRLILVANYAEIAKLYSVTVNMTFTLQDGTTKTLEKVLGGETSDYQLFSKVTAGNEVYTAAEGDVIFGNIITDIPSGGYTGFTLTVTDNNDTVLYEGSAN